MTHSDPGSRTSRGLGDGLENRKRTGQNTWQIHYSIMHINTLLFCRNFSSAEISYTHTITSAEAAKAIDTQHVHVHVPILQFHLPSEPPLMVSIFSFL